MLDANSKGSNIEIIDFDDLLKQFKITEEELDAMPMVSFDFMFRDDAVIKNKKDQYMISSKNIEKGQKVKPSINSSNSRLAVTIGDILKDQ